MVSLRVLLTIKAVADLTQLTEIDRLLCRFISNSFPDAE